MSLWLVMGLSGAGWAAMAWRTRSWAVRQVPPALVVMAVGAGLVGLLANRPDADDSFYLARAMIAWENPGAPIQALYPFAFVAGAGGVFPSLPSWEHFAAALGVLGVGPPVAVQHGVIAFAAGALVPMAWHRLLRGLTGAGPALGGVAVIFGLMVLDGTTHRGIADFGLLRIWQGKVVLVWVLAPLALAVALDVVRGGAGLVRLGAIGVAGIGLSTTAAFFLPVLVGCGAGAWDEEGGVLG